ncbi:hypothetical protein [Undibacterium pigrum]|uniref:Uncharacterized protein n=1 Tax=Undibacterium pigrum TaxID=401470 RepID=A0A318JK55_9BURK|nr:hypothetical protein [Undibacterium pigrum]PXX47512.1 hypothetical protein DFR42_1011094 [Undibacterium pigrum]
MSQLRINLLKLGVCVLLIMGLLMVFSHSAFPNASLFTMAFYSAAFMIFVLALGFASVFITGEFKQWCLNNGATDTGWLWFNAEPPGLEAMRNGIDVTTLSAKAKPSATSSQVTDKT